VDFRRPEGETVKLPSGQDAPAGALLEWEVPFDFPEDWPETARKPFEAFWEAKRAMRREMDASIARRADQEILYDQPQVVRGKVRVSGPFTVEAIPVPAVTDPQRVELALPESLEEALTAPAEGEKEVEEGLLEDVEPERAAAGQELAGGDWIDKLVGLLAKTGVVLADGRRVQIEGLRRAGGQYIHAEGTLSRNSETKRVGVSFGPPYGPVTQLQVEEALREAHWEYDMVLFAGFAFDVEVGAFLDKSPHPKIEVQRAHIAPDVLTGDLLKTTRASQLFTVYGEPEVVLRREGKDWRVELKGVDLYDPRTGETKHEGGDKVAAWFLDTDYDGRSFAVCQAFFPYEAATARDPWDKLERALRGKIDPEAMEAFRGTVSLPFEAGKHRRIAVKVIDLWGNEVVKVSRLEEKATES
jgi:adenine-specific DNA-methyltransferase